MKSGMTTFKGERAIVLNAGSLQAVVLPDRGANLISFRDIKRDLQFIREPVLETMADFDAKPTAYGIPVLFPPNRYEDGRISVRDRTYQFPINESETNNYLHGFLHDAKWEMVSLDLSAHKSRVVLRHSVDQNHGIYPFFPHAFTFVLEYVLTSGELLQKVRVQNNGTTWMPCMVGFHTALQIPFVNSSNVDDYKVRITIGERMELDERGLPTGQWLPLSTAEAALRDTGVPPFHEAMDNHYTARPQVGRNFAVIADVKEHIRLIYDVGQKYRYWMIWNDEACGTVFCPEPQTNMVNAPFAEDNPNDSGVVILQPGESWTECSRLSVQEGLAVQDAVLIG